MSQSKKSKIESDGEMRARSDRERAIGRKKEKVRGGESERKGNSERDSDIAPKGDHDQ